MWGMPKTYNHYPAPGAKVQYTATPQAFYLGFNACNITAVATAANNCVTAAIAKANGGTVTTAIMRAALVANTAVAKAMANAKAINKARKTTFNNKVAKLAAKLSNAPYYTPQQAHAALLAAGISKRNANGCRNQYLIGINGQLTTGSQKVNKHGLTAKGLAVTYYSYTHTCA